MTLITCRDIAALRDIAIDGHTPESSESCNPNHQPWPVLRSFQTRLK